MNIKQKCKTLIFLLSKKYPKTLQKTSKSISKDFIEKVFLFGRNYFPDHGIRHYGKDLKSLKSLFTKDKPFALSEAKLPACYHGVFFSNGFQSQPTILLNTHIKNQGMNLSILAHEIGHLAVYLYRQSYLKAKKEFQIHWIQPLSDNILKSLSDSEELLADMEATIGIYPKDSFQKTFCNSKNKIKWYYKSSFLLFLKACLYVSKYYPELRKNFWKSQNKFFHLCLLIHYARLRIFLHENYEI